MRIALQVYVIGETGILEELDLKGIQHLGGPEDATKTVTLKAGEYMEHDHDVRAWAGRVLAQLQLRALSLLCRAALSNLCAAAALDPAGRVLHFQHTHACTADCR